VRLHLRIFALLSTALVLFAGVAPGLGRCGRHGAGAGGEAMAGHAMEMPAAPAASGAPDQSAGPHAVCCLFMSTCSSHCYVGGGSASARATDSHTAVAGGLARALASVASPPESPPPRA
jgi:hypothetical protein